MTDREEALKIEYELIRSDRRTLSLQIKNGKLIIRAPRRMRRADIDSFVYSHREWIEEHMDICRERLERYREIEPLTSEEMKKLAKRASEVIPARVEHFARILGVDYGRITVRSQLTRWGSCSAKGNLNFNCLLMLAPSEVLDCIVAHELCHRKEMNHSKRFYEHLFRVYPEYHKWHTWLKQHGGELMQRNPKRQEVG
jgi:predicted metal-dependent hydrolase